MRLNPYTQGYHAFGLDEECPYTPLSKDAMEWLDGRHDAALDAEVSNNDPDVLDALESEDAGMIAVELYREGIT